MENFSGHWSQFVYKCQKSLKQKKLKFYHQKSIKSSLKNCNLGNISFFDGNFWWKTLLFLVLGNAFCGTPGNTVQILYKYFTIILHILYSTINVVWPTLKQAITLSERSFWLFGPHTFFHIPQGHCPFVKKNFVDFFRKIYEWKMNNPLKMLSPTFLSS